jgi:hypothetical protein
MTEGVRCEGKRKDGRPCRVAALPGSRYCLFHDPAQAETRRRAQHKGGTNRSKRAAVLPADAPDAPLKTVPDVVTFLALTANRVCRGELDAKVGNCVGVLCGQLLRALGPDDVLREIEELRQQIEAIRNAYPRAAKGS